MGKLIRITVTWQLCIALGAMWFLIPYSYSAEGVSEDGYIVRRAVEDGVWQYRGRPTIEARGGKVFLAYTTTKGEQYIKALDLETNAESAFLLTRTGADAHNNAQFTFTSEGKVLAMYYKSARPWDQPHIHYRISERPYDVTSFGEERFLAVPEVETGILGRQPALRSDMKGNIYVQTHVGPAAAGNVEVLFISNDDGQSFEMRRLWNWQNHYPVNRSYTIFELDAVRGRVHFVTMAKNVQDRFTRAIFYIMYDIEKQAFYRADGRHAFDWSDTPIEDGHRFMDVIKDGSRDYHGFFGDVQVDADGNPYVSWGDRSGGYSQYVRPNIEYWSRVENGSWIQYELGTVSNFRRGSWMHPQSPELVYGIFKIDEEADESIFQVQRRRFDESTRAFVIDKRMSHVMRYNPDDPRDDRKLWAISGSSHADDGEFIAFNMGRFTSMRRGEFASSIYLIDKPHSTPDNE